MCQFLSGIVFQSGRIHIDPEHTDSHEDMIAALGLVDDREFARDWIRVEFTPPNGDLFDVGAYVLTVDEKTTPVWFDDDRRAAAVEYLRSQIRGMILKENRKILLGGCWIVGGNAVIDMVKTSRVVRVADKAKLSGVRDNATVSGVRDNATVSGVRGNATVSGVWDNATVSGVRGNATVSGVRDNATVSDVRGNATVSDVWDNATVSDVWDNATVSGVWDNATVSDVRGNATVSGVRGNATVKNDFRAKPVESPAAAK